MWRGRERWEGGGEEGKEGEGKKGRGRREMERERDSEGELIKTITLHTLVFIQ